MGSKETTIDAGRLAELLRALDGEDEAARATALRDLCPCRSRSYDRETWRAIFHAVDGALDARARHQAWHAVETLVHIAPRNPEAAELLAWLASQGLHPTPPPEERPRGRERVTARQVPALVEAITGDDPDARHRALRTLCPCRNVRYDRQAWQAILWAYEHAEDGTTRDDAGHALGTLLQRARTDPRSQDLLRRLAAEGASLPLEDAIPAWDPARGGPHTLRIPRPPKPRRSRANRRR